MSQLDSAPLLMVWYTGYPFSYHIPNLSSNAALSHVAHMLKSTLFWRMRFLGTLGYVTAIAGIWNWAWISHNFRKIVEYKTDQGYFCYIYLFIFGREYKTCCSWWVFHLVAGSEQSEFWGWVGLLNAPLHPTLPKGYFQFITYSLSRMKIFLKEDF